MSSQDFNRRLVCSARSSISSNGSISTLSGTRSTAKRFFFLSALWQQLSAHDKSRSGHRIPRGKNRTHSRAWPESLGRGRQSHPSPSRTYSTPSRWCSYAPGPIGQMLVPCYPFSIESTPVRQHSQRKTIKNLQELIQHVQFRFIN